MSEAPTAPTAPDAPIAPEAPEAPVLGEEKKTEKPKEEPKKGWTGSQIAGTVLGLLFLLLVFYFFIWPMFKN